MSNSFEEDADDKPSSFAPKPRNAGNGLRMAWYHKHPEDPSCAVCVLPEMKQLEVKAAWLQKIKAKDIAAMFNISWFQVRRHARWANWKWDRARATEVGLAVILEKGVAALKSGEIKVDGKMLMAAIAHVDKREGKIVDLSKSEGNITIHLDTGGVPKPQPARGIATQALASGESEQPRVVAPEAVYVLEEPVYETTPAVASQTDVSVGGESGTSGSGSSE